MQTAGPAGCMSGRQPVPCMSCQRQRPAATKNRVEQVPASARWTATAPRGRGDSVSVSRGKKERCVLGRGGCMCVMCQVWWRACTSMRRRGADPPQQSARRPRTATSQATTFYAARTITHSRCSDNKNAHTHGQRCVQREETAQCEREEKEEWGAWGAGVEARPRARVCGAHSGCQIIQREQDITNRSSSSSVIIVRASESGRGWAQQPHRTKRGRRQQLCRGAPLAAARARHACRAAGCRVRAWQLPRAAMAVCAARAGCCCSSSEGPLAAAVAGNARLHAA